MNFATRPLAILMTLVLFNFLSVSCGSDDDDEPKNPDTEKPSTPDDDDDDPDYESLIIGTWAYEDDGYYQLMGFSPYNEFSLLTEEEEDGNDLYQEFGTYSISGDKLKLKYDDGDRMTITIVSITKRKKLVLEAEGERITAKYVGDWDDYLNYED